VAAAQADAEAANRAADRAEQRYADALATDDELGCEVLLSVVKRKRDEAGRAMTRVNARSMG
jgi:hypothetical protein